MRIKETFTAQLWQGYTRYTSLTTQTNGYTNRTASTHHCLYNTTNIKHCLLIYNTKVHYEYRALQLLNTAQHYICYAPQLWLYDPTALGTMILHTTTIQHLLRLYSTTTLSTNYRCTTLRLPGTTTVWRLHNCVVLLHYKTKLHYIPNCYYTTLTVQHYVCNMS